MIEKPETHTVSDFEAERIQALPALSSFLPIKFENGSTVDGLAINCALCRAELGSDEMKSEVTVNKHNIEVKAYGVCYECKTLTPVNVKLRDDGSMLTLSNGYWLPGQYAKDKAVGVLAWIKMVLSKLVIK